MSNLYENLLQDPYNLYCKYVHLKAHFTTSTFDYFKYKRKTISEGAFNRRIDKPLFFALAKVLGQEQTVPFFVSQFVENNNVSVGTILMDLEKAQTIFDAWKTRIMLLEENYCSDVNLILSFGTWKQMIVPKDNNHSEVQKLLFMKYIQPETYTLLYDTFGLFNKKEIMEDMFIDNNKYKKYRPFLNIERKKILDMTRKK